jgi:hypothetical protein
LTSELVSENLDLLNSGRSMYLVYRVVCFVGW